jgi:hypothetical protein
MRITLLNEKDFTMKKYSVFINGTNFKLKEKGVLKRYGFFTTRYVNAISAKEAEENAFNLVKKEVKKSFIRDLAEPAFMFADEVQELESFGDVLVPGKGFSLYEEKRRSSRTMKLLKQMKKDRG